MAEVGDIPRNKMIFSWLLTYPKSLIAYLYIRKRLLLKEIPKMYYIKYLGYSKALRGKRGQKANKEVM